MKSLRQIAKNRLFNKDGFTLVEVMIALVLLMVAMMAVGSMQVTAIRGNAYGKEMQMAIVIGRDLLERVIAASYSATTYNNVINGNVKDLPKGGVDGSTPTEETVKSKDPANPCHLQEHGVLLLISLL